MVKYPVSAVHILKCHGLSLLDSTVEAGYALNCVRASQGMPTSVLNAKVVCLDINLQRYKMQMGVQVRGVASLGAELLRHDAHDIHSLLFSNMYPHV